jgi:hypothetical protein
VAVLEKGRLVALGTVKELSVDGQLEGRFR